MTLLPMVSVAGSMLWGNKTSATSVKFVVVELFVAYVLNLIILVCYYTSAH